MREETVGDAAAVRRVNEQAFGRPEEAQLVAALRENDAVTLSLVAVEEDGTVVGHVLISPVEIVDDEARRPSVGLGPMAVLPDRQRRGIGSQLIERALAALRDADHGVLVVLGHPEYYPRFGFQPASRFGIDCTFDVPDEVFMALELRPGAAKERRGTVHYRREFQ